MTLFDLVAVQQHLEGLLGGVRVDLVPRDSIHSPLRPRIVREAVDVG